MIAQKGFEIRLFPNEDQKVLIDKNICCYRFVFNKTLEEATAVYTDRGTFTTFKERFSRLVELRKELDWLKEVDSAAMQQSVRDFNRAMDNYFKNKSHFRFPQFKSKKKSRLSYRTPYNGGNADIVDDTHIKVPKVGVIKTKKFSLPSKYKLLNITIVHTSRDRYLAKLCIETEVNSLKKTNKQIGFDVGLIDLLIGSDGSKISPPKFNRLNSEKLAKAQRKLSKMRIKLEKAGIDDISEAKNYQKQKRKVAKIYEHSANCAKNFNHQLSWKLVNEFDLLAFEDLNIKGMVRNHSLAYSIQDVRWSQLMNFIEYKCLWYGKQFVQVPRFYPSSKTCSECGVYHKDIVNSLSVREWTCHDCGTHHDRDINAAKNILNYALGLA